MEVTAVVTDAWTAFSTKISAFIPKLIGAMIILLVGWLVARLVRYGTVKLLQLIKLDQISDATGVKEFLAKGNIHKSISEIVGSLIYWFLLIIVLVAALDALGLAIVSGLLNSVVLYIPNVIAAVIVLTLGVLLGSFLDAAIRTTASNAGLSIANGLGKVALYGIMVFSASIALIQLGIGSDVIASSFEIALGAVALALALAFGLGGREVAAEHLKKWLETKKTPKPAKQ